MTKSPSAAARTLDIEVVIVERPETVGVPTLENVDAVLGWIEDHRPAP